MPNEIAHLKSVLCRSLCADVTVTERPNGLMLVNTPFTFSDGDSYTFVLEPLAKGRYRVTDAGTTLMHMSYENDLGKFREGARGKLFEQIVAETGLTEEDGEFYLDAPTESLGKTVFRFGQAMTRIHDLTFLNRARVESTFYEDLWESLTHLVPADRITRDYVYTAMPNANDYPVDYRIEGGSEQLFMFGIPNRDKARLATIVLEHLLRANAEFRSLLVFADQAQIPRADLARLSNVGGEMVSSLDAQDDLRRKVLKLAA